MAIADINFGVNKLLRDLGLSNLWDVASCTYTLPSENGTSETITFLDASPIVGVNGLDLDPSIVPTAEQILQYFRRKRLQGDDSSGNTFYTHDTIEFTNNLVMYQLPNGKEIVYPWGNKATSFTGIVLLNDTGYIHKAKRLAGLLTKNLDMNGGTLQHPIYGIFPSTFVNKVTITSGQEIFNGSIVVINFLTPNLYDISRSDNDPLATKVLNYITDINSILTGISSLPNIQTELGAIADNPLFKNSSQNPILNGSFLQVSYSDNIVYSPDSLRDNPPNSEHWYVTTKENINNINVVLANAALKLEANNIPTDFDINYNTQVVMELLCQIAGIIVDNYGSGGLSSRTEETDQVPESDIADLVYSEEFENIDGQLVQISRQITGQEIINNSVFYKILVITVTTQLIPTNNSFTAIRNIINNIIVVCNIYSIVYQENYITFAGLISNLEQFYSLILSTEGNTYTVPYDMPLYTASRLTNKSVETLFARNSFLVGHRTLRKGMVLYL